jgi:thioredoxin-like negative regulator of GroEL
MPLLSSTIIFISCHLLFFLSPLSSAPLSLNLDAHLSSGLCTSAAECVSRALTLAAAGDMYSAHPLFKRASELNTSDADAWIGLGGAAKEMGMVSCGRSLLLALYLLISQSNALRWMRQERICCVPHL